MTVKVTRRRVKVWEENHNNGNEPLKTSVTFIHNLPENFSLVHETLSKPLLTLTLQSPNGNHNNGHENPLSLLSITKTPVQYKLTATATIPINSKRHALIHMSTHVEDLNKLKSLLVAAENTVIANLPKIFKNPPKRVKISVEWATTKIQNLQPIPITVDPIPIPLPITTAIEFLMDGKFTSFFSYLPDDLPDQVKTTVNDILQGKVMVKSKVSITYPTS